MLAPAIGMFGYSIGGLIGGGLLSAIGNREVRFTESFLNQLI